MLMGSSRQLGQVADEGDRSRARSQLTSTPGHSIFLPAEDRSYADYASPLRSVYESPTYHAGTVHGLYAV